MFTRLASLIKAFFYHLLYKLDDPEMVLEQNYQKVQNDLISVRKTHKESMERISKLESTIEKLKTKGAELGCPSDGTRHSAFAAKMFC